jgi:hypothetical protein
MKIIYTKLSDQELSDLQPLLKRCNRDVKNFTHSLILAAIRCQKNDRTMIDIDSMGVINNKAK